MLNSCQVYVYGRGLLHQPPLPVVHQATSLFVVRGHRDCDLGLGVCNLLRRVPSMIDGWGAEVVGMEDVYLGFPNWCRVYTLNFLPLKAP